MCNYIASITLQDRDGYSIDCIAFGESSPFALYEILEQVMANCLEVDGFTISDLYSDEDAANYKEAEFTGMPVLVYTICYGNREEDRESIRLYDIDNMIKYTGNKTAEEVKTYGKTDDKKER